MATVRGLQSVTPFSAKRQRQLAHVHQALSVYSSCSSSLQYKRARPALQRWSALTLAALYPIFTSLSSGFDRSWAMEYNRLVWQVELAILPALRLWPGPRANGLNRWEG